MIFLRENQRVVLLEAQSLQTSNQTLGKIESFRGFPAGWSFGRGLAFDESVIDQALDLAAWADLETGFGPGDAFPGLDGEVRVTFYYCSHYLEATINSRNNIDFLHEVNKRVEDEEDGISLEILKEKIFGVWMAVWRMPESSTHSTGTLRDTASKTSPSNPRPGIVRYQSSTWTALDSNLARSAPISAATTAA